MTTHHRKFTVKNRIKNAHFSQTPFKKPRKIAEYRLLATPKKIPGKASLRNRFRMT
jgi:hypothetical protein